MTRMVVNGLATVLPADNHSQASLSRLHTWRNTWVYYPRRNQPTNPQTGRLPEG